MITQTRAIWTDWETPESFKTDHGELIPIRYLKKKLVSEHQWDIDCQYIKSMCKILNFQIYKPNGLYNVPCVHKNQVNQITEAIQTREEMYKR
jgi:hypothetical protein